MLARHGRWRAILAHQSQMQRTNLLVMRGIHEMKDLLEREAKRPLVSIQLPVQSKSFFAKDFAQRKPSTPKVFRDPPSSSIQPFVHHARTPHTSSISPPNFPPPMMMATSPSHQQHLSSRFTSPSTSSSSSSFPASTTRQNRPRFRSPHGAAFVAFPSPFARHKYPTRFTRHAVISPHVLAKQAEKRAATRIQEAERRLQSDDLRSSLLHRATTATISSSGSGATQLLPRAPVVTIMGHVDHGKTTLLDALRHSNVVASESGGITQHIGAFTVDISSFLKNTATEAAPFITFLDTPGHAAFTAMRARGTQVTDMVILVVAADDGLQPQTIEAIQHARASHVPLIVAINKIDVPHRSIDALYDALANHHVICEPLGGDTQVVLISALKRQNLDSLLEAVIAQAALLELKSEQSLESSSTCTGAILESKVVKGRGIVSTVLIKEGILRAGDVILAGTHTFAKVRRLIDDRGTSVVQAIPSVAVETDGWKSLPVIGDSFKRVGSEDVAKEYLLDWQRERDRLQGLQENTVIAEKRRHDAVLHLQQRVQRQNQRALRNAQRNSPSTTAAAAAAAGAAVKEKQRKEAAVENKEVVEPLNVILKTDAQGSMEAIEGMLMEMNTSHAMDGMPVPLRIVCTSVGPVTESDIQLATTSGASVVGFHVTMVDKQVVALAKQAGIQVRLHRIIYELMEDVRKLLTDRAAPLVASTAPVIIEGQADILQVFHVKIRGKKYAVAGCRVVEGTVTRNATLRVIRKNDESIVYEGKLSSLKKNKEDVESVSKGIECGIAWDHPPLMTADDQAFQVGDIIQCIKSPTKMEK